MTGSGTRSDDDRYSAWAALHHAMADSPQHYPVNEWRYRHPLASAIDPAMDLWPLIKTLYMVGACHRVHADAPDKPAAQISPLVPAPRARSPALPPTTRMLWPNLDCEVLMLGSSVGNHAIAGYCSQHHLDPLREALSRCGLRTSTLLTDVTAEAAQHVPTLLGRTLGGARILRAIQSHLPPVDSFALADLVGFNAWHADISALYPLDHVLARPGLEEIIEKIYSTAYCLSRFFAQQALKAVIGYCYYGVIGFAAALACRSLGIPFFDMQHGSAGRHHHCYDWPGMPVGGYNTLPSHFLCWSAVESHAIERCASKYGPKALSVGHSWQLMEQLLLASGTGHGVARYVSSTIKDHYKSACLLASQRKATRAAAGLTTVLLTLRADEDVAWLVPLLTEAGSNFHFLIRLHPAESRDAARLAQRVAALETPTVEVTRPSRLPMSVLLRECSLNLTACSSSVLDALAFGMPSLCYAWSSRWFYSPDQYAQVQIVAPEIGALSAALHARRAADSAPRSPPPCLSLSNLGGQLVAEILTMRATN